MQILRYSVVGATALDWSLPAAAMTVGFVTARHLIPAGKTIIEISRL
jgi:hypothetical protein